MKIEGNYVEEHYYGHYYTNDEGIWADIARSDQPERTEIAYRNLN